ncbi:MAG TPA: bifunctional precorrin-2 dehydrogenase/sirohydrochlorin ferrochelatase [Acidimicrobiales bacterium]|nr:bifunctional precorrin-2 dehydrogenase/sirohydrochlorin ferrochelatase [Acidimicrobiales bacterium]
MGGEELYPVVLRVAGRPCLVVGGGPVAARKCAGLVDCGALVTVVAPRVDPSIEAMGTTVRRRRYRSGEAGHYRLVVTATGIPEIDGQVSADAEAAGVWVNSADDPDRCTFVLPSVHRDSPVTVAVSTGGSSPALAAWLRRRIGEDVGPGLGTLATLMEEARHDLRARGRDTGSVDWRALLDGPLPELVRSGDLKAARALLAQAVADATAGPP